jgi:FlgD Ig-like domain
MKSPLAIASTILGLCVFSPVSHAAFTVVNNGATSWRIDGVDNPTLTLNQGSTYTFNVNASGHPFWIKTVRVTGSGSAYGNGVTNNGVQVGTLTWTVPADAPATLFYQCGVHTSMGGTINVVGPVGVGGPLPRIAWLGRAVPNPTHAGSSFRLGLPRNSEVEIGLFDVRGRRVRTLWHGAMSAGEHTIRWDGLTDGLGAAPSGTYFYRLRVEGRTLTGRLVLAR